MAPKQSFLETLLLDGLIDRGKVRDRGTRSPDTRDACATQIANVFVLFVYDLGVLDHRNTAAIRHLAFYSDGFTAVVGELIIDRLVFTND